MIDYQQLREILPQGFPMLMVDRVLDYQEGKWLKALKNISGNEITFLGHFPEMALMPGALILEGLGQCTIVLYHLTYGKLPAHEMPLFGSVKAKFSRPVFPGDQLIFEVSSVKMTSFGGVFEGEGSVDGQQVVHCELSMGRKSGNDLRGGRQGAVSEPEKAKLEVLAAHK